MGKITDTFKTLLGLDSKQTRYSAQQNEITTWRYSAFSKNAYDLDTVRACIDSIARNVSKMEFNHIVTNADGKKKIIRTSDIARVLKKPNAYMTTRDFIYKCATVHFAENNCFIFPEWNENGKLIAMHPINYQSYKIIETNGNIYINFQIKYTKEYVVALEDIINLKRFYYSKEFSGENNDALLPSAELINSQNQGIINGIKNSAIIRGLLKSVSVIKQEDMIKYREDFIKDNLDSSNNGGVMVVDGKYEYIPLKSEPYSVDSETMKLAKSKIYDYFGVNESFVQNSFSPDQYDAIYEGLLEPFAIMFSQALTNALFTDIEKGYGNEIDVSMNRLKYQPISSITALIGSTNQLGIFTPNEYREMLGYAPLDDGDERLISLNYVKSTDVVDKKENENVE